MKSNDENARLKPEHSRIFLLEDQVVMKWMKLTGLGFWNTKIILTRKKNPFKTSEMHMRLWSGNVVMEVLRYLITCGNTARMAGKKIQQQPGGGHDRRTSL